MEQTKQPVKSFLDEVWGSKIPKVLVGTITYHGKDYCREEFEWRRISLAYENYEIKEIWTDDYKGVSRERITKGYNELLDYFFQGDYDYLLTLEADIIPPRYIIEALMAQNKDVISALYMIGPKGNRFPCVFTDKKLKRRNPDGSLTTHIEGIPMNNIDGSIIEAKGGTGLGCCLIKREVLENIGCFRYGEAHCDMYFHEDAYKFGYKSHVDSSILCKHYGSWEEWQEAIAKNDF
jgi:hypothetical protein